MVYVELGKKNSAGAAKYHMAHLFPFELQIAIGVHSLVCQDTTVYNFVLDVYSTNSEILKCSYLKVGRQW